MDIKDGRRIINEFIVRIKSIQGRQKEKIREEVLDKAKEYVLSELLFIEVGSVIDKYRREIKLTEGMLVEEMLSELEDAKWRLFRKMLDE